MIITGVQARQILDCKCRPMVEVEVHTSNGYVGRGAGPTGQSVGMYEARILPDDDPSDYDGLSVHRAVHNVNTVIGPALLGRDVTLFHFAVDDDEASQGTQLVECARASFDSVWTSIAREYLS